MRILVFSESYLPLRTGVAKFTYELAYHLNRRGHEVVLLTGNYEGMPPAPFPVETVGGVGKVYANGSFTWFIKEYPHRFYGKLREVVRRYGITVFHNQGPLGPPYSMLSALLVSRIDPKVRRVGTFHSKRMNLNPAFKVMGRVLSPLVKFHHTLTAPSLSTAREMEDLFGIRGVEVVPNAVDTSVFRPDLPPLSHLMDSRGTALFVGRLDERKGVDTLVEAWGILQDRLEDFGRRYKLVVVGNGPLRDKVFDAAKRYGNVLLYDDVPMGDPDFPRFYTSSDFAVFPAKGGEAFGIVILEAFASGRPVVITNIPGYNEVATPDTALFVPPGDPIALADAMERMFLDEGLRERMGRRAYVRSHLFSWDTVVERFVEIYSG